MSDLPAQEHNAAARLVDRAGRVATDVPCGNCGYNLRSLAADGKCPECAAPVAGSLHGFMLCYSDPQWVRSLANGLLMVLLAAGGLFVVSLLIAAVVGVYSLARSPTMAFGPGPGVLLVSQLSQFVLGVVAAGVIVAGVRRLTLPEPQWVQVIEGSTARRLARSTCWLLFIPPLANLAANLSMPDMSQFATAATQPQLPPGFFTTMDDVVTLSIVAAAVGSAAYAVAGLSLLAHVAQLLRRLPRPGLRRWSGITFWGLLIGCVLLLVGWSLNTLLLKSFYRAQVAVLTSLPSTAATTAPVVGAPAPTGLSMPSVGVVAGIGVASCVTLIASLATLVLGIAAVIVLIGTCRALYAAAREAAYHRANLGM